VKSMKAEHMSTKPALQALRGIPSRTRRCNERVEAGMEAKK